MEAGVPDERMLKRCRTVWGLECGCGRKGDRTEPPTRLCVCDSSKSAAAQ